ncbi:hypothetical protein L195_g063812, partial [Trifolium pratense]
RCASFLVDQGSGVS